jgi:splicing factor 3B subunit 3
MELHPRKANNCFIKVYEFIEDGKRLKLLHKTVVEDLVLGIDESEGRLFIGVGPVLRVYEIGKKTLLKKNENRNFRSMITKVHCEDSRIFVTD